MRVTRRFVLAAGIASCGLALGGCAVASIDSSSPASLRASVGALAAQLESERPGLGAMFARALYRVAVPAVEPEVRDDFDPLAIPAVATDRPPEPSALSSGYFAALDAVAPKLNGLTPKLVADLYVAADLSALSVQQRWARGFDDRVKRRIAAAAFERTRRESLIDRVTPAKAAYRWTTAVPRIPMLDFRIFNPLDRAMTAVDFAMDLSTPSGRLIASASVPFTFAVALAPQAFGTFSVSLADKPRMADRALADVRDVLLVRLKVLEAYVGDREPVLRDTVDDGLDDRRRMALRRLLSSIDEARANLSKYRQALS